MGQDGFSEVENANLKWLESKVLAREPWLLHAFSTRIGGSSRPPAQGLNLALTALHGQAAVERNREAFFRALHAGRFALAEIRQVHSARVYLVARNKRGKLEYRPSGFDLPRGSRAFVPQGDALVTGQPGILLSIRAADCVPILLADRRQRVVAAVHAGWRGALARVIEKTVGEMVRLFATRPKDLVAAIGPSIRACCYTVGDEVAEAFSARFAEGEKFFRQASRDRPEIGPSISFLSPDPPGHERETRSSFHLDLTAVAHDQLLHAGVLSKNIQTAQFCTACRSDLFFSHRKEGSHTGRMMAVIGIRPEAKKNGK